VLMAVARGRSSRCSTFFRTCYRTLMVTSKDSATPEPAEPVPEWIPAGVMVAGTRYVPRHRRVEVLYTDRAWRLAEVLAWARNQDGWAALVRWPDASEDWRAYDEKFIRPR
jgi:hypothetical protein